MLRSTRDAKVSFFLSFFKINAQVLPAGAFLSAPVP
jgi:hypothetical protein